MKSVSFAALAVVFSMAMVLPAMADGDESKSAPGQQVSQNAAPVSEKPVDKSVEKSAPAPAPEKKSSGIPIAFTIPIWFIIGFAGIAYPSIGAIVASFLIRNSNRRMPGFLVAILSFLWPGTIAATAAAFPAWALWHLTTNYGGTIKAILSGRGLTAGPVEMARFVLHSKVRTVSNCTDRDGNPIAGSSQGHIRSQQAQYYKVDFDSCGGGGVRWIHQDNLMAVNG